MEIEVTFVFTPRAEAVLPPDQPKPPPRSMPFVPAVGDTLAFPEVPGTFFQVIQRQLHMQPGSIDVVLVACLSESTAPHPVR